MQVGERFVPWAVFPGVYMPLALAAYTELSPASKVAWTMLYFLGRDAGAPAPSQAELAVRCGMPLRTMGTCLKELQAKGFIEPDGKRDRCVVWAFLWHACFDGTPLRKSPTSPARSLPDRQTCERGSLPDRQTTPETTSAESAEEPSAAQSDPDEGLKSARSAEDSLPDRQS